MSLEYKSYQIMSKISGNGDIVAKIIYGNKSNEYEIRCRRFKECRGAGYNSGFVIYLCTNPLKCATENPEISFHPLDKLGMKIKEYRQTQESKNYA